MSMYVFAPAGSEAFHNNLLKYAVEFIGSQQKGFGSSWAKGKRYLKKEVLCSGTALKRACVIKNKYVNHDFEEYGTEVYYYQTEDCARIVKTILDYMPIHRYGDYHYYFQDGIHVCIPEKEFENLRWELRFLMEGESRIEHNRKNCALRHEAFSLRNDGTDWCSAIMVDFDDEHILRFLADEEWKRLYIAIKRLSRRQKEVVMLHFYKEMDLDEIAEDWGCDVARIIKILECALIRLRRYIKVEQHNSFLCVNGEK